MLSEEEKLARQILTDLGCDHNELDIEQIEARLRVHSRSLRPLRRGGKND